MLFLFIEQSHAINFFICAILCLIYVIVNMIGMHIHFGSGMQRANMCSNGFAFLMSLPFMPIVFAGFEILLFTSVSLTIFFLSYLIWQLIYITAQHKVSLVNIILPVATINLVAWLVSAFVNYKFAPSLAVFAGSFFA